MLKSVKSSTNHSPQIRAKDLLCICACMKYAPTFFLQAAVSIRNDANSGHAWWLQDWDWNLFDLVILKFRYSCVLVLAYLAGKKKKIDRPKILKIFYIFKYILHYYSRLHYSLAIHKLMHVFYVQIFFKVFYNCKYLSRLRFHVDWQHKWLASRLMYSGQNRSTDCFWLFLTVDPKYAHRGIFDWFLLSFWPPSTIPVKNGQLNLTWKCEVWQCSTFTCAGYILASISTFWLIFFYPCSHRRANTFKVLYI